jgi:hypothetical protein
MPYFFEAWRSVGCVGAGEEEVAKGKARRRGSSRAGSAPGPVVVCFRIIGLFAAAVGDASIMVLRPLE